MGSHMIVTKSTVAKMPKNAPGNRQILTRESQTQLGLCIRQAR